MVEQAVQTGPVDNMNQKKPPPAKVVSGIQRNGRQIPQSSKTNGIQVLFSNGYLVELPSEKCWSNLEQSLSLLDELTFNF